MGMTRPARTFHKRPAGAAKVPGSAPPLLAALAGAVALAAAGALAGAGEPKADDLATQADELLKAQLKKMGEGYSGLVDRERHIVYVSALDEEHFRQTRELIASYVDAQRRTLLETPLAWNLTVLLPTVDDNRKLIASRDGRGDGNRPGNRDANCTFIGLYEPRGHRLTAIDRGSVLIHEFTHALHHADQVAAGQVHPPWVTEGLATLFESARITPSGLEPNTDLRLYSLQNAIRAKKTVPLDALFKMGHKPFLAQADLAYAESRYVMLYLHEKGRLRDWYKRYKATFAEDPGGVKALEAMLNNKLATIEKEWLEWAAALKPPPLPKRAEKARLGLEVQDDPAGVKVVGLADGGAAKQAGRIQVGDVIQEFNGQKTANIAEFVAAVKSAGPMQTVKVKLLHRGQPLTVLQPLDSSSRP